MWWTVFISVEIMASKIRHNSYIKGFPIGRIEHKISQYVDDSTASVSTVESIHPLINTVKDFGSIAGPEINLNIN